MPALAEPVFEELIAASTPAVPSTAWPARTVERLLARSSRWL